MTKPVLGELHPVPSRSMFNGIKNGGSCHDAGLFEHHQRVRCEVILEKPRAFSPELLLELPKIFIKHIGLISYMRFNRYDSFWFQRKRRTEARLSNLSEGTALLGEKAFDSCALFAKLFVCRVHFGARKLVDFEALNDLVLAVFADAREAVDHAWRDAVRTV